MVFNDEQYNLRIEVDTKHCGLSEEEWGRMQAGLAPLSRVAEDFPVSDLYVTIVRHPRTTDYHVKLALVLPGQTLVTGESNFDKDSAFQRSARKLARKVESLKAKMGDEPEIAKHEKGTHQDMIPGREPEAAALDGAVSAGDYAAFRQATFPYEEPVRKRVGRWIERYPEMEAKIGHGLTIADVVEEVFLNAFEDYENRPTEVRFSEWLEGLIDPSVKALLRHTDEELENIRFAQSYREEEEQQG